MMSKADFKALTKREAARIILDAKNPVVLMHVRPDADTAGTAAALCEVFKLLGKSASYACSDDIPKRLKFILEGIPRAEFYKDCDIITVDIASPKQAGEILEKIPTPRLMIDHHALGDPFADNYIRPDASSAAEALFDIIEVLINDGFLTLTKTVAAHFFTAIASDTGGFRFSSARPATFRLAARLIETGIDHAEISHKLFFSKSAEELRAEGFIAGKIKLFQGGRIAVASHDRREREELGLCEGHFDCAIDTVRSIAGVEIALLVRETDKGDFRASIRSTGKDVATVAKAFGGGGHVRAAGCSPIANSKEEAVGMILDELKKLF